MDGFKQTDPQRLRGLAEHAALLAGSVLALALALTGLGCASAGAPTTAGTTALAPQTAAVALVRRAAHVTLAAPATVEFKLEGASAFGSSSGPVLGSGEFDFPSASGSETIDLGEVGHREPGNEQAVFLSERVYLQPKGVGSSVLPKGKEWVSVALTGSDAVSTNFPSFMLQVEGVDPRFLLSELMDGAVAAVPTGNEWIGGIPARRYDVTVDLARALSAVSGPNAPALGQAIQSELAAPRGAGSARAGETSIVAWIGVNGRVIQMRAAPPGAGVGTATMTLCCFGVHVAVSAPSNERVVDIAALTPSGERENNSGGDSDGG